MGLPFRVTGFGAVEHHEVRFAVVVQFLLGGTDEHVLDEVRLPGHLGDETHLEAAVFVRPAEGIHHEQAFGGELVGDDFFQRLPVFRGNRLVVVGRLGAVPPDVLATDIVKHDKLVLGRTAGKNPGVHVHGAELGDDPLLIPLQVGTGLLREQLLIGGVTDDFGGFADTVDG